MSFHLKSSTSTTQGFFISEGGWTVKVDRALLSLQTSTIGETGDDHKCSYRGRGAMRDAVFDPLVGMVQTTGEWWLDRRSMSRDSVVEYLTQIIWAAIDGLTRQSGIVIDPNLPPEENKIIPRKEAAVQTSEIG